MGLRGRLADHEPLADLRVRESAREQVEDFPLARRRAPRPAAAAGGSGGRCRTNSSITARVTAGASSASPLATIRTAAAISSGGASFSMKPLAPGAERVVDVRVEPEGRQDQHARVGLRPDDATRRLDPVEHGHADVHQHDVGPQPPGRGDRVLAVDGLADDRHARARSRGSSAVRRGRAPGRRRSEPTSSDRQNDPDREAAARPPARVEPAAVESDPLAHPDQTVSAARRSLAASRPSSTISSSSESGP